MTESSTDTTFPAAKNALGDSRVVDGAAGTLHMHIVHTEAAEASTIIACRDAVVAMQRDDAACSQPVHHRIIAVSGMGDGIRRHFALQHVACHGVITNTSTLGIYNAVNAAAGHARRHGNRRILLTHWCADSGIPVPFATSRFGGSPPGIDAIMIVGLGDRVIRTARHAASSEAPGWSAQELPAFTGIEAPFANDPIPDRQRLRSGLGFSLLPDDVLIVPVLDRAADVDAIIMMELASVLNIAEIRSAMVLPRHARRHTRALRHLREGYSLGIHFTDDPMAALLPAADIALVPTDSPAAAPSLAIALANAIAHLPHFPFRMILPARWMASAEFDPAHPRIFPARGHGATALGAACVTALAGGVGEHSRQIDPSAAVTETTGTPAHSRQPPPLGSLIAEKWAQLAATS